MIKQRILFIVKILLYSTLGSLILPVSTFSQTDPEQFVRSSAKQMQSIDPLSVDTMDMPLLAKAIGEARVVMLGEQDHGDAHTFKAKLRIIKYLHEKMGFNVIAFESDFFGLNEGWDQLKKDSAAIALFLRRNIFPIWTYCETAAPLFNTYIPGSFLTPNPLVVTGFDDQMVLNYSGNNLRRLLDSIFKSAAIPLCKEIYYDSYIAAIDSIRLSYGDPKINAASYERWEAYFRRMRSEIGQKFPETNFWIRVIDNLISETISFQAIKREHQEAKRNRDYQMAINLYWLAKEKFANEKIIVWAANYHIARYADSLSEKKHLATMGHYFSDLPQAPNTYILGFNSYEGRAGRLGTKAYTITKPRKNSFENWIPESWDYAFVDLSSWLNRHNSGQKKFFMKGLGHMSFETNWQHYYDGIFFIREMIPCTAEK